MVNITWFLGQNLYFFNVFFMALGAHGIVLRKACAVERKEFAEKIPGSVPRAKQERKGLSERKAKTHSFSHGKWKNAYI